MNFNKKGLTGLSMVLGVIILVVLVLLSTSLFGNTLGSGEKEFARYLEKGDYDQDGMTNAIDACPCDVKNSLSSKAYKLKKYEDLPSGQGLFTTSVGIPDRVNKDDAQEIGYYLDHKDIYTELYFVSDDLDAVTNKKPSRDSLCRRKTGEDSSGNAVCSYLDFQRDFFVQSDQGGFLELCATKPVDCNKIIAAAAKTEQEMN